MNLNGVDLNLLLAFDVLMEERSVTRAAQRLCVSQSALSHTLRRLRVLLDDPVLVATVRGMQPTPRAEELINPVRQALNLLDRTISPPANFQPESSTACFTLGSTDYVEYVVLPPLIKHLEKIAPGVRIRLIRFVSEDVELSLERRDIDLVIRLQQKPNKRLRTAPFMRDLSVVLVRMDHPEVDDAMALELYCCLRHVVIDSFETGSNVPKILQNHNVSRNVALRSPNFLSAPVILAESDMIATLPLKIAEMFVRGGRLKIVPCPLPVGEFDFELVWHSLLEKDPAQIWFRQQLLHVAAELSLDTFDDFAGSGQ